MLWEHLPLDQSSRVVLLGIAERCQAYINEAHEGFVGARRDNDVV